MSSLIIVNQTNIVAGSTNTYEYKFPQGSARFENSEIGIASAIIPYSFYNITSAYMNQTLSLKFPITDGTSTSTVAITIPAGFYTLSQLNSYLQSVMISNGFYLVNAAGSNVYYIELVANVQLGTVQLNAYIVPNTVPSGWSNPGSWSLPSSGSRVPQLITDANNFSDLIGFVRSTTFPSTMTQSGTYSTTSSYEPQISPVSSLLLGCNLVDNKLCSPNSIISSIPINTTFGSQITFNPNEYIWLPILDGQYPSLVLSLYDQLANPLNATDTNSINLLIIRERSNNHR